MAKRTPSCKRLLSVKQKLVDWKIGRLEKRPFHPTFLLLVFGVCLSGCGTLFGKGVDPMMSTSAEFTFDTYEVITGVAKHQTVLTGFLLGGPLAELVVTNVDENGDRHLRIYEFNDDTWVPRLGMPLRPEILFVDVANIDGRDRLLTYERGRLNWFDPESEAEQALLAVTVNYNTRDEDAIPHVDITRDLNGDGLDDLVVPDVDGFWVFVQMSDGAFADPVKLGTFTEIDRFYDAEGYRYNPWAQSNIYEVDYNRDGRNDLVFWNEDHFEVHYQNAHGLFALTPETFTTDIAFDSDDLASLVAPYGVRRRRRDHQPTGNMTGRVLHAFTDLNGDGVADIGIFSLKGGSLWHMHSTYEVHFGAPEPDGSTTFPSEVSTTIASDGIPFELMQHDCNGDGQTDTIFATIKPRVFKVISMLVDSVLTRSVSLDLELYRMEGDTYLDKPTDIQKIKSNVTHETGGRAAFPPVLLGDVNGDGRLDLLVGRSQGNLHVFMGVPGPNLFSRKPQKVAVTMPTYEEHTWLMNLNKDNKQDVLMHHTFTTEPHRVTLLIAR